jgi:hypothetical protein
MLPNLLCGSTQKMERTYLFIYFSYFPILQLTRLEMFQLYLNGLMIYELEQNIWI